ncbi:MAG: hypothetical protein ACOY3P_23710 [Planctomycetota bacterium]
MDKILRHIPRLDDEELHLLIEALDVEIARRNEYEALYEESARSRANSRQNSYRRSNGASAPPIFAAGLGKKHGRRWAA